MQNRREGRYRTELLLHRAVYGSFHRDLTRPTEVDAAKIQAACKEAILAVTASKSEKTKPKEIKVKGQ